MDIDGSVAVVTGGASGLGLATGRRLAAAGAAVVLLDVTPADEAAAAGLPGPVVPVVADVTREDEVRGALEAAASLGPLRIVVNCAGVVTPGRILSDRHGVLALDAFTRVVAINLIGTFNVTRLAAERMAATAPGAGERGVIVQTASTAAFDGQIGQVAYAASKGGVVSMTLPLARDLADKLIRVVTVAPGHFLTPAMADLPPEVRSALGAQVPHPARLGDPAEFAALVEHIVSNPMLNGEVIRLDGALRMAAR